MGIAVKRIVSISLGSATRDYRFTTTILGRTVEVERIGTNGDVARAAELVRSFDGKADAIGLGGLSPIFRVGRARYPHHEAIRIAAQARRTPVVDGGVLKSTLERWAVAQANRKLPGLLRYRRVLLTSGIERYQLASAIAQYEPELRFADPIIHIGLPFLPAPRSLEQLELYAATTRAPKPCSPGPTSSPVILPTFAASPLRSSPARPLSPTTPRPPRSRICASAASPPS
jgi:hypothetical protein